MRTRLSICLYVAAAAAALTAQQPQSPQESPPPSASLAAAPQSGGGQATFRTGANYVRVDMYAMEDGQAVQDLTADEIEVLEDGVPQAIEDFEHVVVRPATVQETRNEPDGLSASREAAADPRARVFVIFLDTHHTQVDGTANVRRPLVRFLDRVLGPDDLVAIMTPEMAGSDIALGRKTTIISRILEEEWWGRRARIANDDPKEHLYRVCGAYMRTPERVTEELIARRREKLTLDALDDLMVHLGGLRDERKAVVVVTEGWLLHRPNPELTRVPDDVGPASPLLVLPPPRPVDDSNSFTSDPTMQLECEVDRNLLALVDHDLRLRQITEEANRGNVTFYPVFARGLTAFDAPIGPDPPPSPIQDSANLRTRQNSMRALAVDTDGEAIINTNDIEGGLKRIADDLSSYYLLGYYSTNTTLDGRFREIRVRVTRPGVRVRARRGYRGRTAEEVIASSADADPARDAVTAALNAVAGVNARSEFRIRPSAWSRPDGSAVAGTMWIVGELDYRTRTELAWTAGAQAEIVVAAADGTQVDSRTVEVSAADGAFGIQVPERGTLMPGDYAVRVRLSPEAGSGLVVSDTVRVVVPGQASALGEAVMWRRGPSTGPRHLRTADPRFQRNERLKLELATSAAGEATARLLDRTGKPLPIPVQVSERIEPGGDLRWIVVDAGLAPLGAGEYAIEVTLGEATQITGFRIVP
jgi:VWFA-related protein